MMAKRRGIWDRMTEHEEKNGKLQALCKKIRHGVSPNQVMHNALFPSNSKDYVGYRPRLL